MALIPPLDGVDGDGEAIGAANSTTIENGRLIGLNNDGNGGVMLGAGGHCQSSSLAMPGRARESSAHWHRLV